MKKLLLACVLFYAFNFFAQKETAAHTDPSLRFTENKGQWSNTILFKAQLDGGVLFLENNCLTFNFYDKVKFRKLHHAGLNKMVMEEANIKGHAFKIYFENCNTVTSTERSGIGSDHENFFLGNDQSKWQSNVLNYQKILYKNIYDGIDYEAVTEKGKIKYNFYVKPQSVANIIKLRYEGVTDIHLKEGNLIYKTSISEIVEQKPYAYQFINGRKQEIIVNYELKNNVLSFNFPYGYDKSYELVIDPVLVFAAQSGSTADNFGMCATWDSQGNFYSGGTAFDIGYPATPGAYSVTFNGPTAVGLTDIVITKYNTAGSALLYATYIGGSDAEIVTSLIVDHSNNLCFSGATGSTNFPTTIAAHDNTFNGGIPLSFTFNGTTFNSGTDIYVGKFNSTGGTLLASTFLGGSDNDGVNHVNHLSVVTTTVLEYFVDSLQYNYADQYRGEIQVDMFDNIYIASSTRSSNFPVTANALDNSLGGKQDAIVAKFNNNLTQLLYSTYLGGSLNDCGNSLIVGNSQNVYITGGTCSNDFPTTPGAYNTIYNGGIADGFISNINTLNGSFIASTFIGTPNYDQSYFIQNDVANNIYVYGQSLGNMPVIAAVYSNPGTHQFVSRLNSNLSIMNLSTVLGGNTSNIDISPSAFSVDKCGSIYLSGWGASILSNVPMASMPLMNATQSITDGFDFYLMGLSANAASLIYGSYFGGNQSTEHVDGGTSRIDKNGKFYQSVCAGCQGFDDFPVTPGAWPNIPGNSNQSFNCNNGIFKIDMQPNIVSSNIGTNNTTGCLPFTASLTNVSPGTSFMWDFGNGNTSSVVANPVVTYTVPGTYTVSLVVYNPSACNQKDSSVIYINVSSGITPTLNVSASASIICGGQTTTLNVSGANSYTWSNGANNSIIVTSPTVTTSYTVNGNSFTGCSAEASVITVSVTNCDGFNEYIKNNGNIIIYPNPTNGLFTISSTDLVKDVIIKDVTGKIIQSKENINYHTQNLDLQLSDKGLYFISIKTNSGTNNFKIIKD